MGWCKGDADRGGVAGRHPSPHAPSILHPLNTPPSTSLTPPSAGDLDDLHAFDPATMNWTLLSAALDAPRPLARVGHGFTSAGGKLYVHGGYSYNEGVARSLSPWLASGCPS